MVNRKDGILAAWDVFLDDNYDIMLMTYDGSYRRHVTGAPDKDDTHPWLAVDEKGTWLTWDRTNVLPASGKKGRKNYRGPQVTRRINREVMVS